jgi:hypothetical protein
MSGNICCSGTYVRIREAINRPRKQPDSFGPNDGYGIKSAALSKHVQLMTQNQKSSIKPPSRLEAITHYADEKEGDDDHQMESCSDSGTAATGGQPYALKRFNNQRGCRSGLDARRLRTRFICIRSVYNMLA